MKIIIMTFLTCFIVLQSLGQVNLKNTRWKGQIVRQGNTREITIDFKTDTFYVYRNETELISSFAFSQSHDTLTLAKTGGAGPCQMNSKGIYRLESAEGRKQFYFQVISEECPGRATGWTAGPFSRID